LERPRNASISHFANNVASHILHKALHQPLLARRVDLLPNYLSERLIDPVLPKRKRVEEPFGWGKTIGGLARPMLRGVKKLDFKFTLTMAAYDLIKLPRLIGATA
jgi:hypothetical protein